MTSQQYKYIITIAQEGNLSRAAKKLRITLPYLSKQIQLMEEELGAAILLRNTVSTRLTYVGEEVVRNAQHILSLERQMEQEMVDLMDRCTGVLSIGMSVYHSTYMLPRILTDFYKKYRDTQIHLLEGPVEEMESFVIDGKVDVAICSKESDPLQGMTNILIAREKLLIAVPRKYTIQAAKSNQSDQLPAIQFHQLQGIPFIYLTSGTSLHNMAVQAMERSGFVPASRLESKSLATIYALVLEGVGAAIIPATMANNDIFSETPQFFSVDNPAFSRNIYAIHRSDNYISNACRDFLLLFQRSLNCLQSGARCPLT